MQQQRALTPYERTQLVKYGIPESKLMETQSPVEYLTHHVEFCNLEFYVDDNVLIPRVETEELVAKSVAAAKKIFAQTKKELLITDVGTGSGAIAIALAIQLDQLRIPYRLYASEVSKKALSIAKKNKKLLANTSNIQLLTSNLLEAFLTNEKYSVQFDLIVSNLPYIPSERIPKLDPSVINYEPKLALDGGQSGLELIHKLIRQAKQVVKKHAQIILEVDYTHRYTDFKQHANNWEIIIDKKTSGVRFVTLLRKENA